MKNGDVIEASELGWRVGKWPTKFVFEGDTWYKSGFFSAHGEFAGYWYTNANGNKTIKVFND